MSNTNNEWMIGMGGAEKLSSLADKLYHSILDREIERCGQTFSQYVPWMDSLDASQLYDIKSQSNLLISKREDLESLQKVFYTSESLPIGKINDEVSVFHIDTDIESSPNVRVFNAAIDLVKNSHPSFRMKLKSLCRCIVPFYSTQKNLRSGGAGFSTMKARGAIFLSCPPTSLFPEIELAINLSHELGHQALNTYLMTDPVLESDPDAPVYSAIRLTERPAIRSFHAVVALVYMVEFLRYLIKKGASAERTTYCLQRLTELEMDLMLGIESLKSLRFTKLGQLLLSDCVHTLKQADFWKTERSVAL